MIDITTVNSSWLQSASVYECSKDTTTREIKRAKTKFLRLRSFQSIEYTATIIHPYSFFLLSSRSSLRHNLVLVFSYTSFVCYWKRVPLLLSWTKSEYFFFFGNLVAFCWPKNHIDRGCHFIIFQRKQVVDIIENSYHIPVKSQITNLFHWYRCFVYSDKFRRGKV